MGMGLNLPCRTVVFTSVRKWDGTEFRIVSSGEYTQMASVEEQSLHRKLNCADAALQIHLLTLIGVIFDCCLCCAAVEPAVVVSMIAVS